MKFLITTSLPSFRTKANPSPYLHFHNPASDLSIPLTSPETVDVWICNGPEVTPELLDRWLSRAPPILKSILVRDTTLIPPLHEHASSRVFEIAPFPAQQDPGIQWEESILRDAEKLYARARAQTTIQRIDAPKTHDRKPTVLLVGAGIMNLMTADLLASRGYHVRIVDAGPNPRSSTDWTRLGVTNGGGNARMFTHTEADNYNEKGSEIYQDMRSIFRQTVREGGWSTANQCPLHT